MLKAIIPLLEWVIVLALQQVVLVLQEQVSFVPADAQGSFQSLDRSCAHVQADF